jgi:hypothetical protein
MALGKIKADTLEHSTAGSLDTSYVVNGSAKVWVNFNGTSTVAIRGSNNVTSITDNGTGDYTANFTTAITDANYAVTKTTSTIRVEYKNVANDSTFYDAAEINVVIHGDLT